MTICYFTHWILSFFSLIVCIRMHDITAVEPKNKRHLVSQNDLETFKNQHFINNSRDLPIQALSSKNSIILNNIEYSLDDEGFESFSVLSPKYFNNTNNNILSNQGNSQDNNNNNDDDEGGKSHSPKYEPTSPLWKKVVNDTTIIVVKNEFGDLDYISIYQQSTNSRAFLTPILPKLAKGNADYYDSVVQNYNSQHPLFATITPQDYDLDIMSFYTRDGSMDDEDDTKIYVAGSKMYSSPKTIDDDEGIKTKDTMVDNIPTAKSQPKCDSFRIIDIAIAYDAALCKNVGGTEQKIENHIQTIVGLGSTYYESLCIKVQISHLDGTCDSNNDPYKGLGAKEEVLEKFSNLWMERNRNVDRDTAHFFSGTRFFEGVLGWAYVKGLCSGDQGFGANWIGYTEDIALRATLFAHELGHNAGAPHFGTGCTSWMMAPCGSGLDGFSEESQSKVNDFLSNQKCTRKMNVDNIPPPSTTFFTNPNDDLSVLYYDEPIPPVSTITTTYATTSFFQFQMSPYIELVDDNTTSQKNVKLCLSSSYTYSNNGNIEYDPVLLSKCQIQNEDEGNQKWFLDPNTKFIHSAMDNTKCLSSSKIHLGNQQRRVLVVKDCPLLSHLTSINYTFQWKLHENGYIINRKKAPITKEWLVVQPTRFLVSVSTSNSAYVMIPVLATMSEVKKNQQWRILSY